MAQTSIYSLMVIALYALKAVVLAGRFSGTPQDTQIVESSNALYTCTVQSLEANEQIIFTKDNVRIESGVRPWDRFTIVHVDVFIIKLTISLVTRLDRGNYACQIRTTEGQIVETSAQGMLTVLEIPGDSYPTCISSIRGHVEGEIVELKCVSEETNPLPKLNWDLDTDVRSPTLWNSTENGLFTLHYSFVARKSDNGKSFTCSLQTPVDENVNRKCHYGPLSVQYAPNVTIMSQEYYTGKEMVLICNADANPYPTSFSWTFSKLLEEAQHKIENNNQILRLHNLNPEDDNLNIECTASNTVGSRSAQFIVMFKPEQTTRSSLEDGVKQDADASINDTDITTDSLVVVLAIIFICLFFIVLVLAIPICIIKLHKSRLELNPNQRELPPQPTSYYDQFNNFHIGNEHLQNQNNIGYKTMNSSNGSEQSFPVFESRTLPLSHRLPQSNNISQDSWVMTLPLRPHTERKLTRHRSVEIQVSDLGDKCPIYEEVGKTRRKVCMESKSIMTEPTLNNYGRADKFLEHIHEENGIVEQKEKPNMPIVKSPDFNPELIVYAKTEFV